MRYPHFARHGVGSLDWKNLKGKFKGGITIANILRVYLVAMECSTGKKSVSVEGCLVGTTDCEWLHSW